MAISPISSVTTQTTSATALQNQEQQLLNQIKLLQNQDATGNAAQIRLLQQQYNTLLLQQQQQTQQQLQTAVTSSQQPAAATPPAAQPAAAPQSVGNSVNIKA